MRRYRKRNAVRVPNEQGDEAEYGVVAGQNDIWGARRRLRLEAQWLALEYKLSLAIQQFQNRQLAQLMAAVHWDDNPPHTER